VTLQSTQNLEGLTFGINANGTPTCHWKDKRQKSVGTVLRRAAEVFNPWAKDEMTPESLARMERGKAIHEVIELHDRGLLADYDPLATPWLEGWKIAKAQLGIETWTAIEEPRWLQIDEDTGFWGIIDRATRTAVWDFKSTRKPQESYPIQCALYCRIWGVEQGGVIYVDETGQHEIQQLEPIHFRRADLALELVFPTYRRSA